MGYDITIHVLHIHATYILNTLQTLHLHSYCRDIYALEHRHLSGQICMSDNNDIWSDILSDQRIRREN